MQSVGENAVTDPSSNAPLIAQVWEAMQKFILRHMHL